MAAGALCLVLGLGLLLTVVPRGGDAEERVIDLGLGDAELADDTSGTAPLTPFGDPSTDMVPGPTSPASTSDSRIRYPGLRPPDPSGPALSSPSSPRAFDLYGQAPGPSDDIFDLDLEIRAADDADSARRAEAVRMLRGLTGIAAVTVLIGVALLLDARALRRDPPG